MSQPSQAQVDANRRNAKYGHGPNTPRGKGRSSQNALRHGLTGRIVVLPTEDMEAYNAFSKELIDSLTPETPMERQLAQTVADTQWRLNRARTYEDGMLALGHFEDPGNPPGNYDNRNPEMHSALTAAKVFRENSKTFVNLSLYEQRLSRAHKDAFRQLRELQAERKAMEMRDPGCKLTETLSWDKSTSPTTPMGTAASAGQESARDSRTSSVPGQDLSSQHTNRGLEPLAIGFVNSSGECDSLDTDYDPGAFDPIFFKNSIPVSHSLPVSQHQRSGLVPGKGDSETNTPGQWSGVVPGTRSSETNTPGQPVRPPLRIPDNKAA